MSVPKPYPVLYEEGAQDVVQVFFDKHGRPAVPSSAPSYVVRDIGYADGDSRRDLTSSANSTLDSASSTLAVAAGPASANPLQLTVADGTDFVAGRMYQLATANGGRAELVDVLGKTGNVLELANQVQFSYPTTTSTLKGVECRATFPSAVANDTNRVPGDDVFAVDWDVEGVDGVSLVRQLVVMRRRDRVPCATFADVASVDRDLGVKLRGRDGDELVLQAYKEVMAQARAANVPAEELYIGDDGKLAVVYYALETFYSLNKQASQAEWARERFEKYFTALTGISADSVRVSEATDAGEPVDQAYHPFTRA